MPNWCSNTLCLQHEDTEMIDRALNAFNRGELLNEFIPVPKELMDTVSGFVGDADSTEQKDLEAQQKSNIKKHGYATWYDFCVNEWGTKWDVGNGGSRISPDKSVLSLSFESAWSPPVAAYEKLQDMGFQVTAMYYEPGMAYCGMFDEFGDEYYQLDSMNSNEVRDTIPQELDAEFGISEAMEEYEREEQDEVTTWYKDGVEETGLTPHQVEKEFND